jgi:thioredoxin-related protein
LPEGVNVAEAARLTPTFILLDDAGKELGRLVGYPGDQFFYPALLDLMKKLPERKP